MIFVSVATGFIEQRLGWGSWLRRVCYTLTAKLTFFLPLKARKDTKYQ